MLKQYMLCMLYNQSLQSGQLPQDWKCANIIPVFKKGVKSEATNYQPISLTLQIIKILESIVTTYIAIATSTDCWP